MVSRVGPGTIADDVVDIGRTIEAGRSLSRHDSIRSAGPPVTRQALRNRAWSMTMLEIIIFSWLLILFNCFEKHRL
jgi:hypothetical protein